MTRRTINVPASELPAEERSEDFRATYQWRIFRIMAEFVTGFQFLADLNNLKTVTVFGSSRLLEGTHWYEEARKLGRLLAESEYGVVTGGGPGIMEGANRGASEGGGESIGFNIQLPREERSNPYVARSIAFHYFFSRKVMLSYSAQAYVYFPGGFGTMDEFWELTTLIETKKISQHIPVILVGKEFWGPFVEWIERDLLGKYGVIKPEDLKIFTVVDTPEEVMEIVKRTPHIKYF